MRSLGLIKFIIESSGKGDEVESTHKVLNDLQKLRGQGKAHGSWSTPEGSLIKDADQRLDAVISAIKKSEMFLKILNCRENSLENLPSFGLGRKDKDFLEPKNRD